MLTRFVLLLVCGLLTFVGCSGDGGPVASGGKNAKLNLKYLPQEAVAAAFAFPKQLQSQPELELLPYEIIKAAGEQEFGFDPLEIEQAIAFATAPNLPAPPGFGLILRFSKPPRLADELTVRMQQANVAGTTYFRAGTGQPCFCAMPDNTLLVAPEPTLLKMIATEVADGPLHSMLREAATDSDVTAMLAFAPLREMAKDNLQQLPPLPPELQPLLTIPDHLESVVVSFNVTQGQLTTISLEARDEDSAKELERALVQGLSFVKQMLLDQAAQEFRGEENVDPIEQATGQYLARLADTIESRLKPDRQGATVVITMKADFAASGVLVALLLPAVQAAREAARRSVSSNNLKQIALAMHNHHDVYRHFPASASYDGGQPLLSWRVHVLPFLGERHLYDQFHLDEPWDSEHNRSLIERMPDVYQNPNLPSGDPRTNYLVLTGSGTVFEGKIECRLADVIDGTSRTIMAVEADASQAVIWTRPEDLDYDPADPFSGLGSVRPGGFLVCLVDGSVHFVSTPVDFEVMRALATRSGGENARLPR